MDWPTFGNKTEAQRHEATMKDIAESEARVAAKEKADKAPKEAPKEKKEEKSVRSVIRDYGKRAEVE